MQKQDSKLARQIVLFLIIFGLAFFGARFVIKNYLKPTNTQPAAVESSK